MGCGGAFVFGGVELSVVFTGNFAKLYTLKYTKFCVCETSRLLRSRLFQQNCILPHHVTKMPSRRMCEDEKTFASAQLWY